MANQGDIRNFKELTLGDFVICEVFVGGQWRELRVVDSAMQKLGGGDLRTEIFERERDRISAVAVKRAHEFLSGPIVLNTYHF